MPLNASRIILVTYLREAPTSTAVGLLGGIHPAQHFLEVVFDGFVAKAGPDAQRLRVTHQDRAAAGLQNPFRLERLNHPAGIAAADPKQGRKLLMRQRHVALQAVDWNIWASMQSE